MDTSEQISVALPIYIDLGAKKSRSIFPLNLNHYRNAHYQILNKAKVLFDEQVSRLIAHLPRMKRVTLTFSLYFGSNRAVDVSNVCCIVDKFFCDTLVNSGKLPDDHREIISGVRYVWGGIDRQNPHVIVTLSEIQRAEESETNMQISYSQDEIKEALLDHLNRQIAIQPGQAVVIDFEQDGKELVAFIDITRDKSSEEQIPAPTKIVTPAAAGGKSRGSKKETAQAPAKDPVEKLETPAVEETIEVAVGEQQTESDMETAVTDDPPFPMEGEDVKIDEPSQKPIETEVLKTTGIFANVTSSAAPVQESAIPPAPSGKSLFANLTKPVHDTPATAKAH